MHIVGDSNNQEVSRVETNSGKERRQHFRVIAKSIVVSLTDEQQGQQISGFLKDISEGGMKIQKISSQRQVEPGEYSCEFILPDFGTINVSVEVLGFGSEDEKFSEHLIRMRFLNLAPELKEKIKKYITKRRLEKETTD